MRELFRLAWHRFNVNAAIMGDGQGRLIAVLFYFTVLLPFGIASTLLSDPLRRKNKSDVAWLQREPVPSDINSAKQQG